MTKEDIMKTEMNRSLEQLVEEQVAKWERQRMEKKKKSELFRPLPCITISRDPGSGGSRIAGRLAEDLGMDVVGKKIIQQVAESSALKEKVIASLDERDVGLIDSFLESFFHARHIWPNEYLQYLSKVIAAVGKQGNAIIIGRGGQFLLPPEETFRLRLVAPRDVRIHNVMMHTGCNSVSAEEYVNQTEEDREAFHQKHFGVNWKDPLYYDLVVNTGSLGIDGSIAVIKAAFAEWKKKEVVEKS
jgi:cytidylate kinase